MFSRRLLSVKATSVVHRFAFKGGQATLTLAGHTEMTLAAPKPKAVIDGGMEDVWVKNGSVWQR